MGWSFLRGLAVVSAASFGIVGLFHKSIEKAIDANPLVSSSADANGGTRLHFSPGEDLEQFDRQQLDAAHSSVDISMYSFTDRALAEEVAQLARRGVAIRIYRDQEQFRSEQLFSRGAKPNPIALLHGLPNVHIRVKHGAPRDLMHQKDYCVDGKCLREGSANWSPGAEKVQDNCIWVTTEAGAIASYQHKFEEMWKRPSNLVVQ